MKYVVDASIAIGWLVKQENAIDHTYLLENQNILIAPDLVFPEVCNGIWRLVSAGYVTPKHGHKIASELSDYFDKVFPCAPLMKAAMGISLQLNHPAYDCFYLALAEHQNVQMITADLRLLNKTKTTPYAKLVVGSEMDSS